MTKVSQDRMAFPASKEKQVETTFQNADRGLWDEARGPPSRWRIVDPRVSPGGPALLVSDEQTMRRGFAGSF